MNKSLALLLCFFFIAYHASSQIFTYTFAGTAACPTQGNLVTTANATVTPFSRVASLACSSAAGYFSSSGWTATGKAADSTLQYIEVTITANTGYKLDLTTVSFTLLSSSTGPVNAKISNDGGTGTFTATSPTYTVSTATATNFSWDFTDFTVNAPGAVKFRVYGWGGTSTSGTLKVTNFALNGDVALINGGGGGSSSQWTTTNNNIYYASGGVGIGNTNPNANAKLDVTGSIYSSKVFVGASDSNTLGSMGANLLAVNGTAVFVKAKVASYGPATWPDYVFEPNYKLTPLDSLEQFIQANKHLPGIPAAADIHKNGIDIGETQAALLKKIEELTLIIIQQNKRIEKLEEKQGQSQ